MNIVHYGHACVLVETDDTRLLFDPGAFSTGYADLTDLDAILVTHQHFDHVDKDALPALLRANPSAKLVVEQGTEPTVRELGLTAQVASPGDALTLGGASVTVVGGQHAVIHPEVPVIPNTGFVVDDGAFYHPGDAFYVPAQDIDVLGLPTGAPWLKVSEAVDFLRIVGPRVAVPIHEAVLANPGLHYGMFDSLAPSGTTVIVLERETPTKP